MWLFHLHSMVNIQPFSPVFPLMGYGCGILLIIPSEFQEITHQPFPVAQPFIIYFLPAVFYFPQNIS